MVTMAGSPYRLRPLIFRAVVGAGALVALSACLDPVVLTVAGASAASYVATGKTLTGHAMSYSTGKDCRVMRGFKGETMCQDLPPEDTPEAPAELACYRSIAEVTCYRVENPNETSTRRLP